MALKDWNAIKQARFLKANSNPVVADAEATSDDFVTQHRWKGKSKSPKSANRPRSIYQYSNMGPRLSGLRSIFGVVFFVSKSPLGIEGQKKL